MYNIVLKLKIFREKGLFGQIWVSVMLPFCVFEVSVMLPFSKISGHPLPQSAFLVGGMPWPNIGFGGMSQEKLLQRKSQRQIHEKTAWYLLRGQKNF